jgi:oligopeptide/dipeptide ABC transporter ATP-binding protein
MMDSAPLLSLEDVSTSLVVDGKHSPVILGINLQVHRGEIIGLVGESGSGKSMTARTIMRLLPRGAKTTGRIRLDGEEVPNGGRAIRRFRGSKMAMIFQDPRAHIDPLYRNGSHIAEGLRANRGLRGDAVKQEALGLLRSVGIDEADRVYHSYPSQVSGGMLQRVLIAGALSGDPQLLIADEPTTSLDVTTQAEIAGLLDRIRKQGRGILFITHDLDLAAAICDRTLVMYAGRIMEEQRTESLFESPSHPYTVGLMQARPTLERRLEKITAIPGVPVSAFEAPDGCPFHPRCAFAEDRCATGEIPLEERPHGAKTACIRFSEIEGTLREKAVNV